MERSEYNQVEMEFWEQDLNAETEAQKRQLNAESETQNAVAEARKQQLNDKTETRKRKLKLKQARRKLEITKQIHQEEGCVELAAEAQVDNEVKVVYGIVILIILMGAQVGVQGSSSKRARTARSRSS